jgi:penicillin-binding protein 1A
MALSRSAARVGAALALLVALGGAAAAGLVYFTLLRDLPDFHSLADYSPALTTVVLDRDGREIGEFFEQRRRLVPVAELPKHVVLAFVAGEDDAFFQHSGLDYVAILRAAWVDLVSGEKKQGASTITMQTAKNLLLSPERRFRRKLQEMILARRIEQRFTKDEILYLYLNEIYFGAGAYGVAEAARTYFAKDVRTLGVSEAALLAGLPKAPSKNSPFANPEAAEERRRYVLRRMREAGFVDQAGFDAALAERPVLASPTRTEDFAASGYLVEEVRRTLFERMGGEAVLRGGLTIHTTLDLDLQRAAVHALRGGLETLDHRQGYRGHLRRVEAKAVEAEIVKLAAENGDAPAAALAAGEPRVGVVTRVDRKGQSAKVAFAPGVAASVHLADVAWAREPDPARLPYEEKAIEAVFEVGDVARFVVAPATGDAEAKSAELRVKLFQEPAVEGAFLAFDVASGDVLALVGGYDFERSEFDRALQARRQPGSAFKPFIYAAALGKGMTPVTIVHDRPVVYTDAESGLTWRPENYGRRFLGPLTLRDALARSVNNATIHLLTQVGVDAVISTAQRLGVASPLERNLSLGLGTNPVSLFELVRGYAAFAAGGKLLAPLAIRRVEDPTGRVVLENLPLETTPIDAAGAPASPDAAGAELPLAAGDGRVMDAAQAYLTLDLLRAVIEHPEGTGRRARELGRPLAGKTGTTNDQADAWFVGFSPDIAAGVWVGYDSKHVLGKGETGGRAALPIWIDFMRAAHEGLPPRDFPMPDGIVLVRVDPATGLLADPSSADAYFQAFVEGTEPTESAAAALSNAEGRRRLRLEF